MRSMTYDGTKPHFEAWPSDNSKVNNIWHLTMKVQKGYLEIQDIQTREDLL